MSMAVIAASGVRKRFGDVEAVAGLDLEVREGECFGLLGPNGAGKSTFIRMLYGVALRDAGELSVFGLDPSTGAREIKRRLGVVPQQSALDESLTVRENMGLYAAFVGVPAARRAARVDALLESMALAGKGDATIRELSGGMQRRLAFVRALLGEPRLLVLDEPTTGLDPAIRHALWDKTRELKARGATILLTTHYIHEAEALCDRVAVMDQGRRIALGTPAELIAGSAGAKTLEDVFLALTGRELGAYD